MVTRGAVPVSAALTLSTVRLGRAPAWRDEHALPCLAAVPLSEDHKPNRIDERQRIESAGGVVVWAGTWRVGGVLAVSRAFGDRLLKRYVVAMPDITEQVRPASQLVPGSWATLKSSSELHVKVWGSQPVRCSKEPASMLLGWRLQQ